MSFTLSAHAKYHRDANYDIQWKKARMKLVRTKNKGTNHRRQM